MVPDRFWFPKTRKKHENRQKQRFFGFGHFGHFGNYGSKNINMYVQTPFLAGEPKTTPPIGMGGVGFFGGSKTGPENGQKTDPQKWPFLVHNFQAQECGFAP
jgi:hypothetical protein